MAFSRAVLLISSVSALAASQGQAFNFPDAASLLGERIAPQTATGAESAPVRPNLFREVDLLQLLPGKAGSGKTGSFVCPGCGQVITRLQANAGGTGLGHCHGCGG